MNVKKNSRVQPVHMGHYGRLIPSCVEVAGAQLNLQPSQPSQPIPIKNFGRSPQETEDELLQSDSFSHYDQATWRMYERITSARRLRANSRNTRPAQQAQPATLLTKDLCAFAPRQISRRTMEHNQQSSTAEELIDYAVFAFDDLECY